MVRSILAVVVGSIVIGVCVGIIQSIGHAVYPLPEDFDTTDYEAIVAYIEVAPVGALLFVVVAYAIGSLVGGIVAALIGKEKPILLATIAGSIMMVFGLINVIAIPHPLWMTITVPFCFIPFSCLGAWAITRGS